MSRIRVTFRAVLVGCVSTTLSCAVGVPEDARPALSRTGDKSSAVAAGPQLPGGLAGVGAVAGASAPVATGGAFAPSPPVSRGPIAGDGSTGSGGIGAPSLPPAGGTLGGAGTGAAMPSPSPGAPPVAMPPVAMPPVTMPPVAQNGCSNPALGAGDREVALQFGGAQRSYLAHVPTRAGSATPAPLLVLMHSLAQTAAQTKAALGMDATADAQGFVVVYPQGVGNSWNAGSCCNSNSEDSVGFIREVVADVSRKSCIDPRRVYAAGMANGGMLAFRLACEASDLFAAVAPVSGDLRVTGCAPKRPLGLIAFNGTADSVVPYRGAALSVSAVRQALRCSATATTESFGVDRCDHFTRCDGGVEVTHCTDQGGAHAWSSPLGFATNTVMWTFLSRFRLPD